MTITEKVAYLKGLSEGLGIDTEKSKEGKLISAIIDVLEEVGLSIEDLESTTDELAEEMDAISDDLADVEDDLYGDEDDEEDEFFQVECPNCGELLEIDEEALDLGVIQCPSCQQKFVLDIFDDCDDCGCDCGPHDHEPPHDHPHGPHGPHDHDEEPEELPPAPPKKPLKRPGKKDPKKD